MKQKIKRIGLYFGSFNPIHIGHLVVAEISLNQIELDEVWFVVSPENPAKRKTGELEEADHRLEMVKRAIVGEPKFSACDIEFGMSRPSFTSSTLKLLREQYPEVKFSIIAGTDTQRKMGNYWKNQEEVMDMHDFIVYPRTLTESDLKWQLTEKAHSVSTYIENVPQIDVSATFIRKSIQNNNSIKYLVPDSVIDYIKKYNLFGKK